MEKKSTKVTEGDQRTLEKYAQSQLDDSFSAELLDPVPMLVQRGGIYLICIGLLVLVGYLFLGKAPVIVAATGVIVPEGESISVYSEVGGIVTEVKAIPGERLQAGDAILLLERSDGGNVSAKLQRNVEKLHSDLEALNQDIVSLEGIVEDPEGGWVNEPIAFSTNQAIQWVHQLAQARLDLAVEQRNLEHGNGVQKQQLLEDIELREQQMNLTHQSIERVEASARQVRLELDSLEKNSNVQDASEPELREKVEHLQQLELHFSELRLEASEQAMMLDELRVKSETEPVRLQQSWMQANSRFQSALLVLKRGIRELKSLADERAETLHRLQQDLDRGFEKSSLSNSLVMPVSGTLVESKMQHAGERVEKGMLVATVIPEDSGLEIRAQVPSRDIGFVREGQPVSIKVDAFPFQRFGIVDGTVAQILPNSGQNDTFTVRIKMEKTFVGSDTHPLQLFPGLTIEADLITREARLISLLFGSKQS